MSIKRFRIVTCLCYSLLLITGQISIKYGFWWSLLTFIPAAIVMAWIERDKERSVAREAKALNRDWISR